MRMRQSHGRRDFLFPSRYSTRTLPLANVLAGARERHSQISYIRQDDPPVRRADLFDPDQAKSSVSQTRGSIPQADRASTSPRKSRSLRLLRFIAREIGGTERNLQR